MSVVEVTAHVSQRRQVADFEPREVAFTVRRAVGPGENPMDAARSAYDLARRLVDECDPRLAEDRVITRDLAKEATSGRPARPIVFRPADHPELAKAAGAAAHPAPPADAVQAAASRDPGFYASDSVTIAGISRDFLIAQGFQERPVSPGLWMKALEGEKANLFFDTRDKYHERGHFYAFPWGDGEAWPEAKAHAREEYRILRAAQNPDQRTRVAEVAARPPAPAPAAPGASASKPAPSSPASPAAATTAPGSAPSAPATPAAAAATPSARPSAAAPSSAEEPLFLPKQGPRVGLVRVWIRTDSLRFNQALREWGFTSAGRGYWHGDVPPEKRQRILDWAAAQRGVHAEPPPEVARATA